MVTHCHLNSPLPNRNGKRLINRSQNHCLLKTNPIKTGRINENRILKIFLKKII